MFVDLLLTCNTENALLFWTDRPVKPVAVIFLPNLTGFSALGGQNGRAFSIFLFQNGPAGQAGQAGALNP